MLGVAAGVGPQARVLDQMVEGVPPRAPQVVLEIEVLGMRGAHDASRDAHAIFARRNGIDEVLLVGGA